MLRVRKVAFIVCLLVINCNFQVAKALCPSGWKKRPGTNMCYYGNAKKTPQSARNYCTGKGGDLLIPNDQAEINWVMNQYGNNDSKHFIGIKRHGNAWKSWDGSRVVTFLPWKKQKYHDCVVIKRDYNQYETDKCYHDHGYLCSKLDSCPAGQYMDGNSNCQNCPKGTYRSSAGGVGVSQCSNCPAGKFGSSAGLTSSSCSGSCSKGHYCPEKSTSSTQVKCPAGFYGSTTGLKNSQCSGQCDAGYYCNEASEVASANNRKCKAGRYGVKGATTDQCTGACNAGYYCNAGSSDPNENECGGAAYYCASGSSGPTSVSTGHYSSGGTSDKTRTKQTQCKKGMYCVDGVSQSCPAGTYGDSKMLFTAACSGLCTAGYYCPAGSKSATEKNCGDGFSEKNAIKRYCPTGTPKRQIVDNNHYTIPEDASIYNREAQLPCPAGYTCKGGDKEPTLNWKAGSCDGNVLQIVINERRRTVTDSRHDIADLDVVLASGVTATFSLGNDAPDDFFVENNGMVYYNRNLNYELFASAKMTVIAAAGNHQISCEINLTVNDLNETPYWVTTSPQLIFALEFSPVGTAVGNAMQALDEDLGTDLKYTLVTPNEWIDISSCSGQLFVQKAGIHLSVGDINLEVKVTDNGGASPNSVIDVTIKLIDVNEDVEFESGADSFVYEVNENSLGAQLTGVGSGASTPPVNDPDGDPIYWSIQSGSGYFTINESTGKLKLLNSISLDFEAGILYVVTITITDRKGDPTSKVFNVEVKNTNDAPIIPNCPVERSIDENAPLTTVLDAIPAFDEDGDTLTFTATNSNIWKVVNSGDNMVVLSPKVNLDYENGGDSYTTVVTASDGKGGTATCSVTITVKDINEPPSIPANQIFGISENSPVGTEVCTQDLTTCPKAIQGFDPENTELLWTINSISPAEFTNTFGIDITTGQIKTVSSVLNYEDIALKNTNRFITISVTALDRGYPSLDDTQTIQIKVFNVPEPPSIPQQSFTIDENLANDSLVGEVKYDDPDDPDSDSWNFEFIGDGHKYNGVDAFKIDTNGKIRVKTATSLDYETAYSFVVHVKVTDSSNLSSDEYIPIILENVNEPPFFSMSSAQFTICVFSENDDIVGLVSAADPDYGDTFAYSINDQSNFKIDEATGLIRVATDINTAGSLSLTLTVTDKGLLTASIPVTVVVTSTTCAPKLVKNQMFGIDENSPAGTVLGDIEILAFDTNDGSGNTLVYSIENSVPGVIQDYFTIDASNGRIKVDENSEEIDYEELRDTYGGNQALMTIKVTFGDLKGTGEITITINDVNEAPSILPQSMDILESATDGNVVGNAADTASDPDDGTQLYYSMSSTTDAGVTIPFNMDQSTGVITVAGTSPLDFEIFAAYEDILVTVYDDSNFANARSSETRITILVKNVNEPPYFPQSAYTININEDSSINTNIGIAEAMDPDANTVLQYSIVSGNTDSKFDVDVNTGSFQLKSAADWEDTEQYVLGIEVADGGFIATTAVTINIGNVNDITISSSTGVDLPTSGSSGSIVIVGTNFGKKSPPSSAPTNVEVTYGPASNPSLYTAPNCVVTVSNTEITCGVAEGTGSNLHLSLTINGVHSISVSPSPSVKLSYAAPIITSISGVDNLPTEGGSSIVLTGDNLGSTSGVVFASNNNVGSNRRFLLEANSWLKYKSLSSTSGNIYFAASCEITVAHTEITCSSVSGSGANIQWELSINGQLGAVFNAGAYENPSIQSVLIDGVSSMGIPTTGVLPAPLQINGANMGDTIDLIEIYFINDYGNHLLSCVMTTPHTLIECDAITGGVGGNFQFHVIVDGVSSEIFDTPDFKFQSPVVTALEGDGVDKAFTEGGQVVIINGINFGPLGLVTPIVTYGIVGTEYSAQECSVLNHNSIRCLTAPGTGTGHQWLVVVASQTSALFPANTNYRPPSITFFSEAGALSASTQGNQPVSIHGSNFGPLGGAAVTAYYGWESDATNEKYLATNCAVVVAHTTIRCTTSVGAGNTLFWTVKLDGQESVEATTSYAVPTVSDISITTVGNNDGSLSTSGGDTVVITGSDFGPPEHPEYLQVNYGVNGIGYTPTCVHISHTQLTCTTEAGSGDNLSWVISVRDQFSNPSVSATSYTHPVIVNPPTSGPTDGSSTLLISGTNFAVDDGLTDVAFYFNNIKVLPSGIESGLTSTSGLDELTVSLPEGQGDLDMKLVITTKFQTTIESAIISFTYDPPVIRNIFTTFIEIDGISYVRAEFRGDNFGITPTVYLHQNDDGAADGSGLNINAYIEEQSHSDITVLIPFSDLTGDFGYIYVSVAGAYSDLVNFAAASPTIDLSPNLLTGDDNNVLKQEFNTQGIESIIIPVSGPGISSLYRNVTINGEPCREFVFTLIGAENGEIECGIPAGEGRLNEVVVFVGLIQSAPVYLNYKAPSMDSLSVSSLPTTGGEISILGENFGRPDSDKLQVLMIVKAHDGTEDSVLDLTANIVTSSLSHTKFNVLIPQGEGSGHEMRVIVADQPSDLYAVDYTAPVIDSLSQTTGSTLGNYEISLSGSNFGINPVVKFGDYICINTDSSPDKHDFIKCRLPEGQGSDLDVIVTVADLSSTVTPQTIFSYLPPKISSMDPLSASTRGGIPITIVGSDFGVYDSNIQGTHSMILDKLDSNDEIELLDGDLISFDHTKIVFTLPNGFGKFKFKLLVGGQTVVSDSVFEYDAPSVDFILPVNGSTDGGYEMTITGDSFGSSLTSSSSSGGNGAMISTATVLVGGKSCEITSQDHEEIRCLVPSGVGKEHNVIVTLPYVDPSNSKQFSYFPPDVDCRGCGFQPNIMNSFGGKIIVCGENFGSNPPTAEEGPVSLLVDGVECEKASWSIDVFTCGGTPFITCEVMPTVVGKKNVTITVGGQTSSWGSEARLFETKCRYQSYGLTGEYCLNCDDDTAFGSDEAATCIDPDNDLWGGEPVSNPGWWKVSLVTPGEKEGGCHPKRMEREECPVLLPCEPKSSCLGDNLCAGGYEFLKYTCETKRNQLGTSNATCTVDSDCTNGNGVCSFETPQYCASCGSDGMCECTSSSRCSLCTSGTHFREAGKCVECPNLEWVIVIGVVLIILMMLMVGLILNTKEMNLAFISIGVDYFQVLAMFRRSDVSWPEELVYIFRLMSVFNFNLDLTTPECFIPEFEYRTKWFLTQALPWGPFAIFIVMSLFKLFHKRCIKGIKEKNRLFRHASTMYSLGILIFYYLFLYMLRNQLDIVNCSPTDPSDGNLYTSFTSPSCGGLCECWQPGTLQMELFPFAIFFFFLYSVGFTVAIYLVLRKHRNTILEDQYLRALGYGDTASRLHLGEVCYRIRKRFSRVYYHFSPEYYYWILVIIGRKTAIALTSLLYRKIPSFQFAVALLVMFTSYVLQVKYQPYMSPCEYKDHVEDFLLKSMESPKGEYGMIRNVTNSRLYHLRNRSKSSTVNKKKGAGVGDKVQLHDLSNNTTVIPSNESGFNLPDDETSFRIQNDRVSRFRTNYNTVEGRLLACGVFVCLAGICFESAEENGPYANERVFLTWVTVAVLVVSILYFIAVFINEIGIARQYKWATIPRPISYDVDANELAMRKDIGKQSSDPTNSVLTHTKYGDVTGMIVRNPLMEVKLSSVMKT